MSGRTNSAFYTRKRNKLDCCFTKSVVSFVNRVLVAEISLRNMKPQIALLCLGIFLVKSVLGEDDELVKTAKQLAFMMNFLGLGKQGDDFVNYVKNLDNIGKIGFMLLDTVNNMQKDMPNLQKTLFNFIPNMLDFTKLQSNCETLRTELVSLDIGGICGSPGDVPSLDACGEDKLKTTLCQQFLFDTGPVVQKCMGSAWQSMVQYFQKNPKACMMNIAKMILSSKYGSPEAKEYASQMQIAKD